MSLINQMLRDLESRRSTDEETRAVLDGIGNRHTPSGHRGLLIGLALLAVVLASVTGYLLLMRGENTATAGNTLAATPTPQQPAQPGATETRSVSQQLTRQAPKPAAKQELVTKQTAQPVKEPAPSVADSAPATPPRREQIAEASKPKIQVSNSYSGNSDSPVSGMEKRVRPLRPAQIAEQHYKKGYTLLQRGDRAGAEKEWLKALEVDPAQASSREALAALYYSQARRVEAAEQLAQGLDYNPGNTQLALLSARLKLENGDTGGAITVMERALEEREQSADFYAFLAATYQRQGDYQKSIAAYRQALNRQPRQGVWWMGIGISLENAGKIPEALTAYNEAKKSATLSPKLRSYVEGRIQALQ